MLHFAKATGGASPINDDQGQVGVTIFGDVLLDGTTGGPGDIKDVALWLFNDDNNYKYNGPTLSIFGSAPPAANSWFKYLDNKHVAGTSPTEGEWLTHGVVGTLTLTLDTISQSGGLTPERKFWLRVSVPAGIATQNLTGLKLKAAAVEEAV
jgi:hypothetical protein